ncbi:hypothetical protein [Diaphorobacter caeni]|uniref:hypothetical protein n=1 Tax=Diaphorobacter caeni TaxID=2784387 RepID=UPI00188E422F|nr:hypothetical protein [Diaphorobacter caeni]MBF5006875.1 hypothetical protein [Diaphorobacter caeni]
MTTVAPTQMTFSFEPSLPERWPTLRSYIAHRTPTLAKSAKVIAADMDLNPSTLSRKLNPAEGDTQRFNLDDLEAFLQSTGDAPAVIEYLCAKYMDSPEAREARLLNKVERLAEELAAVTSQLKANKK